MAVPPDPGPFTDSRVAWPKTLSNLALQLTCCMVIDIVRVSFNLILLRENRYSMKTTSLLRPLSTKCIYNEFRQRSSPLFASGRLGWSKSAFAG